jgi:hypothetical protein
VSSTVLYMSMSLDGFVAGPNEGPDNPAGDGGDACTRILEGEDGVTHMHYRVRR